MNSKNSTSNNDAEIIPFKVPVNHSWVSVDSALKLKRFTERNPFSFSSLKPSIGGYVLHPSAYPMPNIKQDVPFTQISSDYVPGERAANDIDIERSRAQYYEPETKKLPLIFLYNNDDHITLKIPIENRVTNLDELNCSDQDSIVGIYLERIFIGSSIRKNVFSQISTYQKIEYLHLDSCGLSVLPPVNSPNLRVFTFCSNPFDDGPEMIAFTLANPRLAVLDFRRTPAASQDITRHEILATSVNLKKLNGRLISVRDRIYSMKQCKNKFHPDYIAYLHFFYQVKAIPEISQLGRWDPRLITDLSLPNCGLTSASLHRFLNLRSLNLAGNSISTLEHSGIQLCRHLISLNLSRNSIENEEELLCLPYLDSLLHLWLDGNFLTFYRSFVIYLCFKLRGTSAKTGLRSLDGIPVTIEETLKSFLEYDERDLDPDQLLPIKWKYNLDRIAGGRVVTKDPSVFSRFYSLSMNHRGLRRLNLGIFTKLTHLSLRNNLFEEIKGLPSLVNLHHLDISHNPQLNFDQVLNDIAQLKRLQFLMIAIDCWDDPGLILLKKEEFFIDDAPRLSIRNKRYRDGVLSRLLGFLPSLQYFDRIRISVDERVKYFSMSGLDPKILESYRVFAAMIQAAIPNSWIDLSIEGVVPGRQYKPDSVKALLETSNCGLVSNQYLCFRSFTALYEIDLSFNNITSITGLGFENHPSLRFIDISNNSINDKLKHIGRLIDSIPNLEMFSIRNNPCMTVDNSRKVLISHIQRVGSFDDCFRTLDFEISPIDIVESRTWPSETTKQQKRQSLFLYALKARIPLGVSVRSITELNLRDCSLYTLSLNKFVSLKNLYVSDNRIRSIDNLSGLDQLQNLEILDFRRNNIAEIETFAQIISMLPSLKNLGISNNPCTENYNKARSQIVKMVKYFANPKFNLACLDDQPITPTEIAKTHPKRVSSDVLPEFSFLIAVNRNAPSSAILDISNSQLSSFLDFSSKTSLTHINLSHNSITTQAIFTSQLNKCINLIVLDLSFNQISPPETHVPGIGLYLSHFEHLQHLSIEKNPICHSIDDWRTFLVSYPGLDNIECALDTINGHTLTIDERVQFVLLQSKSVDKSSEFRLSYILKQKDPEWKRSKAISLHHCGLTILRPLIDATQLQILDISNNSIKTLKNQGFEKMIQLTSLDIHDNSIETIEEIRDVLSNCPRLERLYMENSTFDKSLTSNPQKYIGFLCISLRGIQEVDHYLNPRPLSSAELNALKDLDNLCKWNNPNQLFRIDLSGKGITETDFNTVLLALGELRPEIIDLSNNPCNNSDKYRFKVIYHVPDAREVDGRAVTIDERMNADKSIRYTIGEGVLAGMVIDGVVVGSEYIDQEKRAETVGTVQIAAQYAAKFGTAMMKWEIFITFQQILTQIFQFIKKSVWPKLYLSFAWICFPFTIDLSFLSYMLDIKLPFWFHYGSFFVYIVLPALLFGLYHFQLDREKWIGAFTYGYSRTKKLTFYGFLIMILCSAGLSLLADFNYTYATHKISNNQYSWFTILGGSSFLIIIIVAFVECKIRKNVGDPIFWFRLLKTKKRFSLFFMTVLYFPICKSFVDTFQCSGNTIKTFPEIMCLKTYEDVQVIHVAAFLFGMIYSIGIPVFFFKLIKKGVSEIDINYKIQLRLDQLEEQKEAVKEKKKNGEDVTELEKELEETEKEISKSYSQAAIEYENAAAYLYNAYDRPNRYKKIVSMIEKLSYLLFTAFIPSKWTQAVLQAGLMGLMTVWQIIENPFAAISENILEGMAKIFNLITLLCGTVLEFDIFKSQVFKEYIAPYLLVGIVVLLFIVFLVILVKNHCCSSSEIEETPYQQLPQEDNMEQFRAQSEVLKSTLKDDDVTVRITSILDEEFEPSIKGYGDMSDNPDGQIVERVENL